MMLMKPRVWDGHDHCGRSPHPRWHGSAQIRGHGCLQGKYGLIHVKDERLIG